MCLRQCQRRIEIERIAQRMRHHDGARSRTDCVREPLRNHRIVAQVHIDKHGDQAILDERRHGGRESGRHGDDLVARFQPACP